MIYAMNHDAIIKRGGIVANSSFVFWKCEACGAYALYDEELMNLYRNPEDMANHEPADMPDRPDPPCSCCGRSNTFRLAPDEDLEKIRASPWGFAL